MKNDDKMIELQSSYQEYYTQIQNTKLENNLNKLWDCEHKAKSAQILLELNRLNFKHITEMHRMIDKIQEAANKDYIDQRKRVNKQIKYLLDGYEDE